MFIWQENIEYYTSWLQEGFLPRKDAIPPIPYGEDREQNVGQKEIDFIRENMGRLVRDNAEPWNLSMPLWYAMISIEC